MNLNQRIEILVKLGEYLSSDEPELAAAKEKASRENGWFVPQFIELASANISQSFLQHDVLTRFIDAYPNISPGPLAKQLGIVMAGNIPLVGFHDFLCGFLTGYSLLLKPSSKDEVLIRHLVGKMIDWAPALANTIRFAEQLKGCDSYIATGSNNSGRYFDFYFKNYPSIIRKNRTSIALLTGKETPTELSRLADDMMLYFGLGCRNVSKIYVPHNYDFIPLLQSIAPYSWMAEHNKYKNNYDYNLALHLLNNKFYMTDGTILLVESKSLFSPISQIHYEYYDPVAPDDIASRHKEELQCIIGEGHFAFGQAQAPTISDFADGVDTMAFLTNL